MDNKFQLSRRTLLWFGAATLLWWVTDAEATARREKSKASVSKVLKGCLACETAHNERIGSKPFATSRDIKKAIDAKRLVRLPDSGPGYILSEDEFGKSLQSRLKDPSEIAAAVEAYKHVLPHVAKYIRAVAYDFARAFGTHFEITSLNRSVVYQQMLRWENSNASRSFSSHTVGRAVDITRKGLTREQHDWLERRFADDERSGKIFATRENRQYCFHIVPKEPSKKQDRT